MSIQISCLYSIIRKAIVGNYDRWNWKKKLLKKAIKKIHILRIEMFLKSKIILNPNIGFLGNIQHKFFKF
jgi:hypothetical protein